MLENKLHIRFASETDLFTVFQFIQELAEFEKLSHIVTATPEGLREALFSDKSVCETVLAFYESQAVGFALFFHNFSTFVGRKGLYLEDLYITPKARGLGIGKKLFQFLVDLAKERGCGRMEWVCLDWNKKAIKFYEDFGAKAMDDWRVFRLSLK